MREREHWKNRSVFIMAAVGSAIGLGNLWRFPYIAAQNGGGAFLVPYLIALLTAGIPLMIIEYGLDIRSQGSANIALGAIRPWLRYVGWLAILGAFASPPASTSSPPDASASTESEKASHPFGSLPVNSAL